jgi:hypothetical protein
MTHSWYMRRRHACSAALLGLSLACVASAASTAGYGSLHYAVACALGAFAGCWLTWVAITLTISPFVTLNTSTLRFRISSLIEHQASIREITSVGAIRGTVILNLASGKSPLIIPAYCWRHRVEAAAFVKILASQGVTLDNESLP